MSRPLPINLRDPHAVIPFADGGFSTTLSYKDRQRLHKVLQKVHLRHFPAHMLTAYECDKLLDAWGPKVQETLLRQAVDAGVVA
jgi:hypothetical protein